MTGSREAGVSKTVTKMHSGLDLPAFSSGMKGELNLRALPSSLECEYS